MEAIAARTADRRSVRYLGNRVHIEVAIRSRLLAACNDENSRRKMQNVRRDSSVIPPGPALLLLE